MTPYIITAVAALIVGYCFGRSGRNEYSDYISEISFLKLDLENEKERRRYFANVARNLQLRNQPMIFYGMDAASDLADATVYAFASRLEKKYEYLRPFYQNSKSYNPEFKKIFSTLHHLDDMAHATFDVAKDARSIAAKTHKLVRDAIQEETRPVEEKEKIDPLLCSKCQSASVSREGGRCSDCV